MDRLNRKDIVMITAENPNAIKADKAFNERVNKGLLADLKKLGANVIPIEGHYGSKESSFFVEGIKPADAVKLKKKYQQESVLTHRGLEGEFINPVNFNKITFDQKVKDFYSVIKINGKDVKFQVDVDLEKIRIYHYSGQKLTNVDPKYFGKNTYTSERDTQRHKVGMFYISPDDKERRVGNVEHFTDVKLSDLYDFNADPKHFFDEAEKLFRSKFGEGQMFTYQRQKDFITDVLKKKGYKGLIAKWSGTKRVEMFGVTKVK